MRPIKLLWGNKKLRFAFLVLIFGVLVGLVWLVWPERLTLRLKIVRTGIEDGKPAVLFRVEGAEQYELHIKSFGYVVGDTPHSTLSLNYSPAREFWALDASEYFADSADRGWKVEANAYVLGPDKKSLGKALRTIKDAWREYRWWRRGPRPPSFLSLAKSRWNRDGNYVITEQTITSDLITNTPPH